MITTKTGDNGKSRIKNCCIRKNSKIIEVIGSLDELNSWLGLCCYILRDHKDILQFSIKKVSSIMSKLAGYKACIEEMDIKRLEDYINNMEKKVKIEGFLNVCAEKDACFVNITRAVCRRTERTLVVLKKINIKKELIFINRLSDLLFLLFAEMRKK